MPDEFQNENDNTTPQWPTPITRLPTEHNSLAATDNQPLSTVISQDPAEDASTILPSTDPQSSIPSPSSSKPSSDLARKRQRNNIAARKYRQKRIDRIAELEQELRAISKERDELRVELARKDAETRMLREIIGRPAMD